MGEDGAATPTEFALLRSELLLPLTELRGDVRLILQRMDQGDARAAEHGNALAALDHRVDLVERTTVTREDLAEAKRKLREEMAAQRAADQKRADRRLTVVGICLTVLVGAIGVAVSIIAIIAK